MGGFYFIEPHTVRLLGRKCGLRVLKESAPDASNIYLNRDFLVVFEKEVVAGGAQSAAAE